MKSVNQCIEEYDAAYYSFKRSPTEANAERLSQAEEALDSAQDRAQTCETDNHRRKP